MIKRDKLDIGGWHKGKCYFIVTDISEKYQKKQTLLECKFFAENIKHALKIILEYQYECK
jgi:hypothetical protein